MSEYSNQIQNESPETKKIESLIDKSDKYRQNNELHKSKEFALIALKLAIKYNNKDQISKSYNLLGLYHHSLNQYDKSMDNFQKAISISNEIGDKVMLSTTLNNLAVVYIDINDEDMALKSYLESIEYDDSNFRSYNNAATIYAKRQEFEKAKALFERAYNLAAKLKSIRSMMILSLNITEMELKQNNTKEALASIKNAKKYLDDLQDPDMNIYYHLLLAEVQQDTKHSVKALQNYETALKLTENVQDKMLRIKCLEALKNYHALTEDFRKAFEYSCEEQTLREQLFNTELTQKIAGIVAVNEIEQKELKAQQMMEKSSRLVTIGVMAAGITHEINQPLNAISVSANSVLYWNRKNKGVLPEIFIEELDQISEGASRIDEIIRHMRSFWVPQEDSKDSEQIALNEAIKSAIGLVERQLYAHGINLRNLLCDKEILVKTSKVNMEQVIINLLNNAMQSLDTSSSNNKEIIIESCEINGKCTVTISDNGMGLPIGNEEKLFDPFFSTKSPKEGMGLGLAIVQNILQKMNGEIYAENNKKNGASFVFSIPVIVEEL